MANLATIDLNMAAVDFRAAHAELVRLKVDRNGARPDTDAFRRAIAGWANWVDDVALALQARTQDHETRIADIEADPGVTDHGALTGLEDDDHPQYLRVDDLPGELAAVRVAVNDSGTSIEDCTSITFDDEDGPYNVTGAAGAASVTFEYDTPVAAGAALAEGSSRAAARADHVHTVSISVVDRILYDVILANLATNALTNGTESIDGRGWSVAAAALAGTLAVTNTIGFQFRNGTSAGSFDFDNTTQTSPVVEISLATLLAGLGYDPRGTYAFEFYFTTSTLEASARWQFHARSAAGTPTGSSSRLLSVGRRNNAGTVVNNIRNNGTNTTVINAGAENCFGMVLDQYGRVTMTMGTYASGFPTMEPIGILQQTIATIGPYLRTDMLVGWSFQSTNDASPTDALDVNRFRVLRVG